MGRRVESHAILTNAAHHTIEAVMSLAVIGGLVAGHHFHRPEVDGYIGIVISAWLLYLGYTHGKDAVVPLLGKAPSKKTIQKIRETAKSLDGVENVHEIIVHDYGSMYTISLHAEIPEKFGPAEMHEIAERCEGKLRETFGGEVICHTDPLLEHSPEVQAVEDRFKELLKGFSQITDYHDFRVIAESRQRIIIIADIDVSDDVPESEFKQISRDLEARVSEEIPNIAYCQFYITPKYAY
jgi:divalent metal cation (Fe/Co/Zn/Cd) transporter